MKRLLVNTILNPTAPKLRPTLALFGLTRQEGLHTKSIPVKEVQIPVRWGHIAGKLWGNGNERPILALHGWQDNAGTWDPLIPLLETKRPVLAVDMPGHGLSSFIPPGMQYFAWELPRVIYSIQEYFKWDKVSLLAHSMGSIASLRYACLFPDLVDFYVAIDSLVADDYDLDAVIEKYPLYVRKLELDQERLGKEPPSYTLEQIANIWHLGTKKSISLQSTQYLIKRGTKQSKADPNKYYFSRDARLKHILFIPEDKKFVEAAVKRLQCPTLYIKGIDSPYSTDAFSVEMRELIESNNNKFESHFVPGTHHLHLNDPEVVAAPINQFLLKYDSNN